MKRKNLWICKNCLSAIQSREGKQLTIAHDIELEFDQRTEENSKCEWCEQTDNDVLYELI